MAVALETFVKQLTDSGIIAPGKLEAFIPPKASPKDAEELARRLVQSKHLTKYQCQEIYKGRARSLILGNYTILDKIGAGGMGQVFKAEHRRMHRAVAIKMLPAAMTRDAVALARFEREVTAAARLGHPNIVAAHDADESGGVHFLVMEYVEGQDLSAHVKKDGPLPVAKAVNYILQAARGLEFAHAEGVVHRDIKPANLLLDPKGTVKILDMGLALIESGGAAATQAELTGTGAVMGTVDYMAPEQALGAHHADARADIYSLGISLYYLIAGKAAYDGETLMAKLLAHREEPIPSLQDVQANVSKPLEAVFRKMVAKKAEDRYQSMSEVIDALEGLGFGGSGTNRRGDAATALMLSDEDRKKLSSKATKKRLGPLSDAVASEKTKYLFAKIVGGAFATIIAPILVTYLIKYLEKDNTPPNPPAANAPAADVPSGDVAASVALQQASTVASAPDSGFALEFDGKTSYVVTPIRYNGKHPLTVEAFVHCHRRMDSVDTVICDESGGSSGFSLEARKSKWRLALHGAPSHSILEPDAFQFDKEVHLAGLFDGSEIRLFVDGVLQGAESSEIKASPFPILIGGNPTGDTKHPKALSIFDGLIDEVRISNVARYTGAFTPSRRFTPDANTLALYHCDEGSGDVLKDSSDFHNDAMIIGAKWVKVGSSGSLRPEPLAPVAPPNKPGGRISDPAFRQWMKDVAAMPAKMQGEAVGKKLMELNPGFDGNVTPKIQNGAVTTFSLITDDVTDISPVRALTGLTFLTCSGSGRGRGSLSDLSPLEGMALTVVSCNNNPVSDLSPLRGMRLARLECNNTLVSDVSPLVGTKLMSLKCERTRVSNLSPLANCKNLKNLSVLGAKVTAASVAALQKALPDCKIEWDDPTNPALPDAAESAKPITAFKEPAFQQWMKTVQAMPAEKQVEAVAKKLMELNPGFDGQVRGVDARAPRIENGVVTELKIVIDDVADISPVRALAGLKVLALSISSSAVNSELSDLSPLRGMRLTSLSFGFSAVADLSPLEGMPLTSLKCGNSQVTDLTPLKGMPLTSLHCPGTSVSDLTPLRGMRLTLLICQNTQVSDLSPLIGMPLATLSVARTNVTAAGVAAIQKALPNCKIEWPAIGQIYSPPASPVTPKNPTGK